MMISPSPSDLKKMIHRSAPPDHTGRLIKSIIDFYFQSFAMLLRCCASSARFAAAQAELGRPWNNALKVNKI